jgi:hypothetical protein
MRNAPTVLARRTVGEWELSSSYPYANPFTDVRIDATFTSPSGKVHTMPGFYDGHGTWRVRFNPGEEGVWTYRIAAWPNNADLSADGRLTVTAGPKRGFLRCTPGQAWGFHFENGDPVLVWGDTTYNLFGMGYCGGDVVAFMKRRLSQGFNLLRIRVPVSPFHPPRGYSHWQTRRTLPWMGSEQCPQFDRFNLDYFQYVDGVVRQIDELGLGIEMIMEAWGFEFPFNSRQIFTREWEELWLRYLIARYDAFSCIWFWTPLNEYEYYPNGDWHYKPIADRWAMDIARWIKAVAPHGHIISMHNGPREPAFAQRFRADPGSVDAIMFQDWGTRDKDSGWLAAGIEDVIGRAFEGWWGGAVFAEYGYERNPAFELNIPGHAYCDTAHSRRAAWRGLSCGMGVIHGFKNSWGPWMLLEEDLPGVIDIMHERRFFTEIAPFYNLRPARDVVVARDWPFGHRPLALANSGKDSIVVYLPAGGRLDLAMAADASHAAQWFDPRTGDLSSATPVGGQGALSFDPPAGVDANGHPLDWALLLRRGS